MALKNNWTNRVDGQDICSADDVNKIAGAVIELEDAVAASGVWELLIEDTIEEEQSLAVWDFDASAVLVTITLPKTTTAEAFDLVLVFRDENAEFAAVESQQTPTSADRHITMWSDFDGGDLMKIHTTGRVASAPEAMWVRPYTQIKRLENFVGFTSFSLTGYIHAGTVVQIYGAKR